MAGVREFPEPRVRDHFRQHLGILGRHHRVQFAPQDQRGGGDLREPGVQARQVLHALQVDQAEPGIHALAAQQQVLQAGPPGRRRLPGPAGVVHAVELLTHDRGERARSARPRPGPVRAVHEDQRGAFGPVLQREFLREQTAERVTHDVEGRRDGELGQDGAVQAGYPAQRGVRLPRRGAHARVVHADHPVPLSQAGELPGEDARPDVDRVHEDQGGAITGGEHLDLAAGEPEHALAGARRDLAEHGRVLVPGRLPVSGTLQLSEGRFLIEQHGTQHLRRLPLSLVKTVREAHGPRPAPASRPGRGHRRRNRPARRPGCR